MLWKGGTCYRIYNHFHSSKYLIISLPFFINHFSTWKKNTLRTLPTSLSHFPLTQFSFYRFHTSPVSFNLISTCLELWRCYWSWLCWLNFPQSLLNLCTRVFSPLLDACTNSWKKRIPLLYSLWPRPLSHLYYNKCLAIMNMKGLVFVVRYSQVQLYKWQAILISSISSLLI